MRGKVCAVFGCSNYEVEKNARSFFRFPRDKNMCDLWVLKCHRSDLDKAYKKEGTLRLYKNYKICSDHFQASDFKNPRLYSQGVTVLKDKKNRRSKGVAFVLFFKKDDAAACARSVNGQEMFGRTLKASLAIDNGRSAEFIRRRTYPDKSRCYECGEEGHLSYKCPNNALGERDPPPKKKKKKKSIAKDENQTEDLYASDEENIYSEVNVRVSGQITKEESDNDDDAEDVDDVETLSAAIRMEQERAELEQYRMKVAMGNYEDSAADTRPRKRIRPNSYFSDEEEVSD